MINDRNSSTSSSWGELILNSLDREFYQTRLDDANLTCNIPDIVNFPNYLRKKGIFNTIICILMSTYLFILMAILCDKYLVPAMERLCYCMYTYILYTFCSLHWYQLTIHSPASFVWRSWCHLLGGCHISTRIIHSICGYIYYRGRHWHWDDSWIIGIQFTGYCSCMWNSNRRCK